MNDAYLATKAERLGHMMGGPAGLLRRIADEPTKERGVLSPGHNLYIEIALAVGFCGVVVPMKTTRQGMRCGPGSSRKRLHDNGSPSRDLATTGEREGADQAVWGQLYHGAEVAQAADHGRQADGSERAAFDRAEP